MAQLAVAWVLQNPNVSAAIVGASRPEQVHDNVKASGVKLDADLLKAIDEILDPIAERDPAKTVSPRAAPVTVVPVLASARASPVLGQSPCDQRARLGPEADQLEADPESSRGQADHVGEPVHRVEEPAADPRLPEQREEQDEAVRRHRS